MKSGGANRPAEHARGGTPLRGRRRQRVPRQRESAAHRSTASTTQPRDREQVEAWWKRWPDAGIGTPDFDVVDVDLYKPECRPTWERIRPLDPDRAHRTTAPAAAACSSSSRPGTLREGKIGPGVDCRYAGRNYVVLPPSPHPSGGRYEAVVDVLTRRPKPAPDFPLDANGGGTAAEIAKKLKTGEKITDDRNTSTFWHAVQLLEQGTPPTSSNTSSRSG